MERPLGGINPIELFAHPEQWHASLPSQTCEKLEKQKKYLESRTRGSERWKNLALAATVVITPTIEAAAFYFENPRLVFMGLVVGGGLGVLFWLNKENADKSRWMGREIVKVLESRQELSDRN